MASTGLLTLVAITYGGRCHIPEWWIIVGYSWEHHSLWQWKCKILDFSNAVLGQMIHKFECPALGWGISMIIFILVKPFAALICVLSSTERTQLAAEYIWRGYMKFGTVSLVILEVILSDRSHRTRLRRLYISAFTVHFKKARYN